MASLMDLFYEQEDRLLTNEGPAEHWIYKAWSRVLDAEVWFVCCEQEVTQLIRQEVPRSAIYTKTEILELLNLPNPSAETIKSLHQIRSYFGAAALKTDDGKDFEERKRSP